MQATSASPAAPADVRTGNRLVNPGFEGAFALHGASEIVVGEGWTPWYDGALVRPEFKDEPYVRYKPDGGVYAFSLRVFHGRALQKFFTSSAAHDAGLSQRVAVPPGARVRLSVFVMAWTSDCDDPCVSPLTRCPGSNNSNGEYRVQIGIDPGGAPPAPEPPPAGVVWSPDVGSEAWDRWVRLGLEADAAGDAVTVYLRGRAKWAVKHNDSHWDEARLEVVAPTSTASASPTAAATGGTPAGATASPTPSPSSTPPAEATGVPTQPPTAAVFLLLAADDARLLLAARARGGGPAAPRDAVPPGANIVIEYPIRSHLGMVNFNQPSCDELAFEQVLIRNADRRGPDGRLDLANAAGDVYTFPPIRLDGGEFVRV
ncbi:MAG: hypothetical protein U0470_08590 [Anaerolineae bacterium]